MSTPNIAISIIIPTHNRAGALLQALKALEAQTFPCREFEVIVVADGCTDDTALRVRAYQAPYPLKLVEQESNGAAAARNAGAAQATGLLLLFLDDDITASPQLVAAHVAAHQNTENGVVMGYLPVVLTHQKGFFRTQLRVWWEDIFAPMFHKGHRFHYRNLLSGNFSLPARLFHSVGGFDASYKCQEDYELGIRLIEANAQFGFAPQAMGHHNEVTDLHRSTQRKYAEGKAAVQFCCEYPQLAETLSVFNQFKYGFVPYYRRMLKLIYTRPGAAAFQAGIYMQAIKLAEWLRMRKTWMKLVDRLLGYWYMRGIADSVQNLESLTNLLKQVYRNPQQQAPALDIDLKQGLEAAEQKLDELRPSSANLFYGKHFIGCIPARSGFERLRGVHLRPLLAGAFSHSLMEALALENIPQPNEQKQSRGMRPTTAEMLAG